MTPQEFKAWFDGFTEAFTGTPTKAQWARVKERVAEIDGKPVTERVFVDRYWPTYVPYFPAYPYWTHTGRIYGQGVGISGYATGLSNGSSTQSNTLASVGSTYNQAQASVGQNFNSLAAMSDLGRADARAIQ